jgi:hypothetical protein
MGRNVAVHFGTGLSNCALAEPRVTNASAAALKETIVSSRHTTEIVSVALQAALAAKIVVATGRSDSPKNQKLRNKADRRGTEEI